MPVGITNATIISINNITQISNFTTYTGFIKNVNDVAFGGWMVFLLLIVMAIIVWLGLTHENSEPVPTLLAVCFAFSLISILLRIVGLLSDYLSFIFPAMTLLLFFFMWASKQMS